MDIIQRASQALASAQFDVAERMSRSALVTHPRDARLWLTLGVALNARANFIEAATAFARATELDPAWGAAWVNLGTALRSAKQLDAAAHAYKEAARRGVDSPDFLFNVGLLHLDRLEFPLAETVLREAVRRAPHDAEIVCCFAGCCYDCVHNDEALAALSGWRELQGLDAALLTRIGTLLLNLTDSQGAQDAIAQALQADPGSRDARLCQIRMLERTNRLDDANGALSQLLTQLRPGDVDDEVLLVQAQLAQRLGHHARARTLLEGLAQRIDDIRRHEPLFLLAKSLDALGDYTGAFACLERAHAAQMRFLESTAPRFTAADDDAFAIVEYPTDAKDAATWMRLPATPNRPDPIFIVGFPRSGTTLLEQMLDAHPALAAMDEQPFLQNAIDHIRSLGVNYPEELGRLTPADWATARERYWERVATRVRLAPGQRLVDKNPLNLLRLPAMRGLFPDARVILAVRHPGDVLVSNFMQHFRAPAFARMCSSWGSLAQGYQRAFEFWYREAERLHPQVMTLRYEDLVTDFEARVRELAAFLDLEWNPAMLNPAQRAQERGFISTPSYAQVVQPIHRRAVERWRNYATQVAPALAGLDDLMRLWGYTA